MFNEKWDIVLKEETKKEYFKELMQKIEKLYQENVIFPPYQKIYKTLEKTDYDEVKVVILGQDPYHGYNEANGLAFSVPDGIKIPPSLRNIFALLYKNLGIPRKQTDLTDWAEQGVLLLNTILTVEKNKPLSHKDIGWEIFTDKIIKELNNRQEPMVFILMGNNARSKKNLITNKKHLIIETSHPSPFSVHKGFSSSNIFNQTNDFLVKNGYNKIEW